MKAFEAGRFKELQRLLATAADPLTEGAAQNILRELTHPALSVPAPATLVAQAQALCGKLQRQRLAAAAPALTTQLHAAYAAHDFSAVGGALVALDALQTEAGEPCVSGAAAETVHDARAWYGEQQSAREKDLEFQREVTKLENWLAEDGASPHVKRQLALLKKFQRDLPASLLTRSRAYLDRQAALGRRARLTRRALLAAAVLICLGLCGLAGWWVQTSHARGALLAKLKEYTQTQSFEEGQALKAQLPPETLADPLVQAALIELEKGAADEKARVTEFKYILNRATQLLQDAHPNVTEAHRAQAGADALARTDAEKRQCADLHARLAALEDALRTGVLKQAKDFLRQAGQALSAAEELQKQNSPDLARLRALAVQAQEPLDAAAKLAVLPGELADQIPKYQERAQGLQRGLEELAAAARDRADFQEAARETIARAREALPDVSGYHKILSDFAGARRAKRLDCSGVPEVRDLPRWERFAPVYAAVLAINEKAPAFSGKSFQDFRGELLKNPAWAQGAGPYESVLKPLARRAEFCADAAGNLAALDALLKHDLLTRLWEFTATVNGKEIKYYTHDKASFRAVINDQEQIDIFQDETLEARSRIVPQKHSEVQECAHVKLGRELKALLDQERDQPQWDSPVPRMLDAVVQAKEAVPYVRALLLNELLALDQRWGPVLALPAETSVKVAALCASKVKFWLPGDEAVAKQLDDIRAGLDALGPPVAVEARKYIGQEGRRKAQLAGLFRKLVLSAVVAQDSEGRCKAVFLSGATFPEYWTIASADGDTVFKLAAFKDSSGALHWVDLGEPGGALAPGQPLLSPADRLNTLTLWREQIHDKAAMEAVSPFPVNLQVLDGVK